MKYLLIFILFAHQLFAQNSVAIFKNGTAFMIKKQTIDASEGKFIFQEIPKSTFGTLWFSAENNQIKSVISSEQSLLSQKNVVAIPDLLKNNLGKKAIFTFRNDPKLEGSAEQVEENLVLIKTNTGKWFSVEPSEVRNVEFLEKPNFQTEVKENKKVLQVEFNKKNSSQNLQTMYLQKGIAWTPNYWLDLTSENQGKMILRASVINDVEDLENSNFSFVVGLPNFMYSHLESALLANSATDFINRISQNYTPFYQNNTMQQRRSDLSNNMAQQAISYSNDENEESSNENLTVTEAEGSQNEDLFFYQLSGVSIKKGGRALLDIQQSNVAYEHLYEVALTGAEIDRNLVQHYVTFKNESKLPWTTGTILMTKNGNPLSQDKMTYTPVGGKTKILLTSVPNISVKNTEREISKEENIKLKDKNFYDLITIEGKVTIKSYKDSDLLLSVTRNFLGDALQANPAWKLEKLVRFSDTQNVSNQAEWKVSLKAGKSEEITYQYKYYAKK